MRPITTLAMAPMAVSMPTAAPAAAPTSPAANPTDTFQPTGAREGLAKALFYAGRSTWLAGGAFFAGGLVASFFAPGALLPAIGGGLALEATAGAEYVASNKVRGFQHPFLAAIHPTWRYEDMAPRAGDLKWG